MTAAPTAADNGCPLEFVQLGAGTALPTDSLRCHVTRTCRACAVSTTSSGQHAFFSATADSPLQPQLATGPTPQEGTCASCGARDRMDSAERWTTAGDQLLVHVRRSGAADGGAPLRYERLLVVGDTRFQLRAVVTAAGGHFTVYAARAGGDFTHFDGDVASATDEARLLDQREGAFLLFYDVAPPPAPSRRSPPSVSPAASDASSPDRPPAGAADPAPASSAPASSAPASAPSQPPPPSPAGPAPAAAPLCVSRTKHGRPCKSPAWDPRWPHCIDHTPGLLGDPSRGDKFHGSTMRTSANRCGRRCALRLPPHGRRTWAGDRVRAAVPPTPCAAY